MSPTDVLSDTNPTRGAVKIWGRDAVLDAQRLAAFVAALPAPR